MGIRIYLSNDQLSLAQKCAENLSGFKSVFRPVNIVTQTAGMNRWLSIFMAEQTGIFANFNFQSPNALVSQLFRLADLRSSDLFETEKTRWIVYDIISSPQFVTQFGDISEYFKDDHLKQIQLATKIADLLDQYLVYRPDMIEAWNQNQSFKFTKENYQRHEAWQQYIWQELRAKLGENASDKVTLKKHLINKFQDPDFAELLKAKVTGITLFGLSVLTEYHLEIIHHLSQVISVDLYFLNPAPGEFWYDNKDENLIRYIERKTGKKREELYLSEGNALLASLGQAGQNSFSVFLNDSDFINSIIDDELRIPDDSTLLGHVQREIYFNTPDEDRTHIPFEKLRDGSISINSCFTIAREVEAVYNQLLFWFEQDADLEPKDILVMTSDIDLYAPYIQAVFDLAPPNRFVPYSIADRTYSDSNNLFSLIEILLNLNSENFTAEYVLQICELPLIANKFALNDPKFLEELLLKCNIKTGISGLIDNHTHLVSWEYGLERLLLSYAMLDDVKVAGTTDHLFTIGGLDGAKGRAALSFYDFAQKLILSVRKRKNQKSLIDWRQYIEDTLNDLVDFDLVDPEELHHLQLHFTKLETTNPHFEQSVKFEVFKNAFLSSLFSNRRDGHFLTGRVTFSSMIPMRSIPFKNVALLGLDRDRFPRQEDRLGFNLILANKRKSDRNVRDNDKYLFLEALLSARKELYISYIGKDPISNKNFQPSIVVDELLNYIISASDLEPELAREALVTHHGLHNYNSNRLSNKEYFGAIKPYSGLHQTSKSKDTSHSFDEIEFHSFAQFFKDPFKFYYNKTLAIYLDDDDEQDYESELFELNNLAQFKIKNLIVGEELDLEDYVNKGEKTGVLPLKNMAWVPVEKAKTELVFLKKAVDKIKGDKLLESVSFTTSTETGLLVGNLDNVVGEYLISPHFSSKTSLEKKKVELTLISLIIDANQLPYSVTLIDIEGNTSVFNSRRLSKHEATLKLEKLIEWYKLGHEKLIYYSPKINSGIAKGESLEKALGTILKDSIPSKFSSYFNPYIRMEAQKGQFEIALDEKAEAIVEIANLLNCYADE